MSFAQYLQQATTPPMRPKPAEKDGEETGSADSEQAATKIAEMIYQPRKQYRKRNLLTDYNKPPLGKSPAAENQGYGPSNKPGGRRNPHADYNTPPVPSPTATEIQPARSNPSARSKPITAGGENQQPGSSKKPTTTTTLGDNGPEGKPIEPGAKSKLTEGLNNTPAGISRQSAESNPRPSSSRGVETTFFCFFCSGTKSLKDRHPGRSNTCAQCHAYYMAQVAARSFHPLSPSLCFCQPLQAAFDFY